MALIVRREKRLATRLLSARKLSTDVSLTRLPFRHPTFLFFDLLIISSSAAQATKEEEDLNYSSTIRQELCQYHDDVVSF